MWRNCYYDPKFSTIHEFTWNEKGERVTLTSPFRPFLLVETESKSNFKSVYGTNLEMKSFDNSYQRYKFVEREEGRLFFNLSPEQQYLIGKYRKAERSDFNKHEIRTFMLDIEAPAKFEFPAPEHAKYEIDLMTIHDSLTDTYHVWGKRPFDMTSMGDAFKQLGGSIEAATEDNVKYYEIEDEAERLEHMVSFWEENCPDVYSGWNIDGFDTPYLINRIKLKLGKNDFKRLSPVGSVTKREGFDKFGNPQIQYKIKGVSMMDYMDVFKTFTFNAERESWKLDDVASDILGCGKVDIGDISLYDLSRTEWDKYGVYNIVDVALLVSMDRQLKFIDIGRSTAYEGYSNIVDCLGKIVTITGSIAKYALDEQLIIETRKPQDNVSFEGGYVKTPEPMMRTNISTYDITSLYPTNMMVLGVSHETKVGAVRGYDDGYVFFEEYGEPKRKLEEEFKPYLKSKGYCISPADIIFDQNKDGIINKFVRTQFNNKSEFSRLSKEAKRNGDEAAAEEYARLGQITKIFLNSCYGVVSAAKSPLYDLDIARSITLTGQGVIKKAAELANNFAVENFGTTRDIVIGGDTDSIFIDFTEVVENRNTTMFDDETLSPFGNKLCKLYEKVLNNGVNDWMREDMLCVNPTYNFEREKAAASALFFAKKQYAYYVLNNEGFDLPPEKRMKYTGLKVVRSEYSAMVKKFMGELYELVLSQYLKLGHDECRRAMSDLVKSHKEQFYNAPFFDISKRQKANNITKYENDFIDRYRHGLHCPAQVNACVCHNRLIEDLDLKGKYQQHQGGVKAMWVYTLPNKWGIKNCAGNDGKLPEEFGLEIDVDKMFEKLYLPVAHQIFEVVGWNFPNIYYDEMVDLDDLMS